MKVKFQSEVDMEIHARQVILSHDDPEELICSQVSTMNRNSLRRASAGKYAEILIDVAIFSFLVNLTLWNDVDQKR